MKKHQILTILFMLVAFWGQAQTAPSMPIISWPINNAVFQRNGIGSSASANLVFSGQVLNRNATKFSIERLDEYGNFNSYFKYNENILGIANLGTQAGYYYFTLSVPTGWYRLVLSDQGGLQTSVKFGVGEVFIIAGQSNALGYGDTFKIESVQNYDCVISCKNTQGHFNYLSRPVLGNLNPYSPSIGPLSNRPWFYQQLGEKIVKKENGVIPVCFFNVAVGATSIDQWYNSMLKVRNEMFGNNYANTLSYGTNEFHQGAWASTPAIDKREPYLTFKNVISFYANLFGVRSVLWHQGESETQQLLKQKSNSFVNGLQFPYFNLNSYSDKLNAVIADSRSILPNLPWSISKVSLIAAFTWNSSANKNVPYPNTTSTNNQLLIPGWNPINYDIGNSVTQEQAEVVGENPNLNSWMSQNSDQFTSPAYRNIAGDDYTHFNENGLVEMANDVFSNMDIIFGKTPISPTILPKASVAKNSCPVNTYSGYTPPMYSTYYWGYSTLVQNYTGGTFNTQNYTNGISGIVKNSSGAISIMTPDIYFGGVSGARVGVQEEISTSLAYPNPTLGAEVLNVKVKLNEDSPVSIQVYDTQNNLLSEKEVLGVGEHDLVIDLPQSTSTMPFEVLYIKIVSNGNIITSHKIQLTK